MLFHKFCICALVLLLIFIYFYVKKENFENDAANSNPSVTLPDTISFQLTNEIAKVLEISPARIYNLKYEGDVKTNLLYVDFEIYDNIVAYKSEISQSQANKKAFNLVINDIFFVTINNQAVKLQKIKVVVNNSALFDNSVYFKNEGLKDIANYSNNKYITVPNDESITKFYTLEFDEDYKLMPKLK
jgi:hypothetical protein